MVNLLRSSLIIFLIVIITVWWYAIRPDPSFNAKTSLHAHLRGNPETVAGSVTNPTDEAPPAHSEHSETQSFVSNEAIETEEELIEILASTNLMRTAETTALVERLKLSNAKNMAEALHKSFRETSLKDSAQRSRILLIAEAWRAVELLPLWHDLAFRETARGKSEDSEINQIEPSELGVAIRTEMLSGIGNLGILASRESRALEDLKTIVMRPDEKIHPVFIRERAYLALKEADAMAAAVAFRSLPEGDSLRERLVK